MLAFAAKGKVKADIEPQPLSVINQVLDRLERGEVAARVVLDFSAGCFFNLKVRKTKMKILLAADGSAYTKKALKFIVDHKHLRTAQSELLVVNVQPLLPTVFNVVLSVEKALELHESEAEKVFLPIRKFLDKNGVKYRCVSLIGSIASKIAAAAENEHVNLIVMGTHGRDFLGAAVMGSVAQKVLAQSSIPVMLVK